MIKKTAPIHPGEILLEEFLRPMNTTSNKLAVSIGVPISRTDRIVKEKRGITAGRALRLAAYFGTTAEFWINLQSHHDLARAALQKGPEIARIRPVAA